MQTLPNPLSPRQLLRAVMSHTIPRRLFMVSGPKNNGQVALTFDDGPHPEHTPALLDRLKSQDVRATFFVIGKNAAAHPQLVQRIVGEGHELGHHSYTHSDPAATSTFALLAEVSRTRDFLKGLVGQAPTLFRPPLGKVTAAKQLALIAARQTVVLWNRDPKDFNATSVEELRGRLTELAIQAGDIFLMHDNHALAAQTVDTLVDRVRARGLRFGRIGNWVSGPGSG